MKLSDYLKTNGLSLQRAAAQMNVSWTTLWRWSKGRAQPTDESIAMVVAWSGGAVTAEDMQATNGPAVARAAREAAKRAKAAPVKMAAKRRGVAS